MLLLTAEADLGRRGAHLALLLELGSTSVGGLLLGLGLLQGGLGDDDVVVSRDSALSSHFCDRGRWTARWSVEIGRAHV